MIGEEPAQRLFAAGRSFCARRPWASRASARGSRCPAIKASIIARPDTPCSVRGTDGELDLGVFEQLFDALLLAGPVLAPGHAGSG